MELLIINYRQTPLYRKTSILRKNVIRRIFPLKRALSVLELNWTKAKDRVGLCSVTHYPQRVTSHGHFFKLVKRQPVATCSRTTFCMWHRRQLVVVVQHNSNRPAPLKMCFCPQHLSVASSLLLGRGRSPAKYLPKPR